MGKAFRGVNRGWKCGALIRAPAPDHFGLASRLHGIEQLALLN